MSLYNKYRPTSFEDIVGNRKTIKSLELLLKKENPPHAYLLIGPTGCGKTTISRIIAKELGCGDEFREIDSADFRGIDTIREIRSSSRHVSLRSNCRVYLIDECHKMTNDAQNALLKGLEDPPPHVFYVLATTEPERLIKTIRGRCSTFPVAPLNEVQMVRLLYRIVNKEEKKTKKSILIEVFERSEGRPRDAIQMLEQLIELPIVEQKKLIRQLSVEDNPQVIKLCRALTQKAPWVQINIILKELKGEDPEQIRRAILGYCSAILLNSSNNAVARIMQHMLEPFFYTGFPGLVISCYEITKGKD